MSLVKNHSVQTLIILLLQFTGLQAWCETRSGQDGIYERVEHEYGSELTALCDEGDTLVKGECAARAENIVPKQIMQLNDGLRPDIEHVTRFESKEVKEQGRTGWSCRATVVRADQELLTTTAAKCQKNKTPGSPGV